MSQPLRRASRLGHRQKNAIAYALFLFVPVVLYIAAYVYPVVDTVALSFFRWDGFSPSKTFVGLANYADLLGKDSFVHAAINNGKWLLYYLVAPTLVGLGLALLLDEELKGSTIFRTIFFIPFTITTVAVASTWHWLYEPNVGAVNYVLRGIGLGALAQNWLGDPATNTYAIMLASLWSWSGFTFLIYFAGLRNIPAEYIEAARIDGASAWTILWRIKMPMLLPSTIVVLGIAGTDSMRVFDLIWSMTQGGPYRSSSVLAVEMYQTSFTNLDFGAGAAIAVYLLVLAAIVVLPYLYFMSTRIPDNEE